MRVLIILATLIHIVGCSTTATIYLKDGRSIEGKIKRSDPASVYVALKNSGRVIGVYRSSVQRIDHPGDVHAVVGTLLGMVGWAAVIAGFALDADCEEICGIGVALFSIPGFVVAIPSTIVSIWGWSTWGSSRSAAAYHGPRMVPLAMTDGEKTYYGIGMSWAW